MKYALLAVLPISMLMSEGMLYAKCKQKEYLVIGFVNDVDSGAPLEGARVYVFVDERAVADIESRTAGDGSFSGSFHFDSFRRSSFFGDKCDRVPEVLEVVVSKEGYRALRKEMAVREQNILRRERETIQLHTIGISQRR